MTIKKGKVSQSKHLGSMHEKGAKIENRPADVPSGQRWWDETRVREEQMPGALWSTVLSILHKRQAFEAQRQLCARLYGGMVPTTAYGTTFDRLQTIHPSLSGRLTHNLFAIILDTINAKLTRTNLSTQFVTNGGDYKMQRRAKKLSQFSDGISYETKMDELGPQMLMDGLLQNEGILHTYEDWSTHRVVTERVMPTEMYVDFVDGLYRKPTQIHRARDINREILAAAYPDMKDAIYACRGSAFGALRADLQDLTDNVTVGESYHLPSGIDENGDPLPDGQHVLYLSNCVLTPKEERGWDKMRFPFTVYRWKNAPFGWHGISLAQELIGSQMELNHLLIMFQRAFRMMAAFRIWIETGTIPDQHFQDRIGTILHGPHGSQVPQFLTPPALNEQYFRHFDAIKARAYEVARLSMLSAVGQKPAGLDSGEAQRVYHDIESEGFSLAQKGYENALLDVTELQVDTVRDIMTREKKYTLRAPVRSSSLLGQKFLRTIDWNRVALDKDEYIIRGYSTSALPATPAGRYAMIQDMMRDNLCDAETGRRLLDMPDLIQMNTLLGAAEDWITASLDSIVEDGKYKDPDPFMNLAMAKKLGVQEYSLGAPNGMEKAKLEMLRKWCNTCDRLLQKANFQAQLTLQQTQQAAAKAAGAPGAGAGLSPTQQVTTQPGPQGPQNAAA